MACNPTSIHPKLNINGSHIPASMNIIVRNMGYGQLLSKLGNKRVLIWTCTTCARFCANIGGTDSMQMLSEQRRKAGVDVAGICMWR